MKRTAVMGVLAFDENKRKNNETIPSRFSLKKKSKKFFVLRHLCPVHWTNCQFIWSRKVYIWLSSWEFQKLWLWQPCLNKLMHVENWETDHLQHDLDISYNFTLAWVFVSHASTQINMNIFIHDLVLFRGIQC